MKSRIFDCIKSYFRKNNNTSYESSDQTTDFLDYCIGTHMFFRTSTTASPRIIGDG